MHEMEAKKELIHQTLIKKYKEDKPKAQEILVEYTDDYNFYTFGELESTLIIHQFRSS